MTETDPRSHSATPERRPKWIKGFKSLFRCETTNTNGTSVVERVRSLVLNRLLDGFEGKLTTSKYAKLARCSQDTALRDILPLVERGILVRGPEGGRSTSYSLAPSPGTS